MSLRTSPMETTSFRQKVFVFSAVGLKQLLSTLFLNECV